MRGMNQNSQAEDDEIAYEINKAKEKATRHNSGKPKVSLVLEASEAIDGLALALEYGVTKYGRGNYMQGNGLKLTEVADSLLRHTKAWLDGENIDPESGLPHVDLMQANTLMLSQLSKTRDNDDRTKY